MILARVLVIVNQLFALVLVINLRYFVRMDFALTTKQAAEILGVTPGRVRQMVIDGVLQATHFGQNLAINAASVEAAKSRKTRPGPVSAKSASQSDLDINFSLDLDTPSSPKIKSSKRRTSRKK